MNVGDTWNGWTINKLLGEGSYGKVYWVGGGGVGENFSITYYTKMLDSVEINTEE